MTQAVPYPYPVHHLKLSTGLSIAYMDEGQGPETIIMVHGMATYAPGWRHNIAGLSRHYRCIALDLPGNGRSSKGPFPYSMQFFAGCLAECCRLLGIKRPWLMGHSMGGQIVMHRYLQAPEAVKGLILCAPAGFETFSLTDRTLYQQSQAFLNLFISQEHSLEQSIRSSFYHMPPAAQQMIQDLTRLMHTQPARDYRHMLDACVQAMMQEPVYDRLQEIQCPALVIFGSHDALIPNRLLHPQSTRQLAEAGVALMPHARLQMMGNAGHFVQWEQAGPVNQAILEFVRANSHTN